MPLKKATGNMYPWVTHLHTHLGGECPHACSYCYVDSRRFGRPVRYTGPLHFIVEEMDVDYGSGKTIFIEHMNDLFACSVPDLWIESILAHCWKYPLNDFVFQTKDPAGIRKDRRELHLPINSMVGTTLETNRDNSFSKAPQPLARLKGMLALTCAKFVTIEPIMEFDVDVLASWIDLIEPLFVNIGADSQGHGLPEPSADKVRALIAELKARKIDVREKPNLKRLLASA